MRIAKQPLVSIISPAYNSSGTIARCIDSVVTQTFHSWEMLVINDGSQDETAQIVSEIAAKDSRIKLVNMPQNSGAAAARNKGIEQAEGRYFAFLDADDRWLPAKLEAQLTFMQSNDYPISCTYYKVVDQKGNAGATLKAPEHITYQKMLYHNSMGCLTVMFDGKHFGKRYFPLIPMRQDYALWLELLRTEDAHCLTEVLAEYTAGSKDSLSANKLKASSWNWHVLRNREKLPVIKAAYYFVNFALYGILKKLR